MSQLPVLVSCKTVVVTRPLHQQEELKDALEDGGFEVLSYPTIVIQPVEEAKDRLQCLASFQESDWTIFTSANAVDVTFKVLRESEAYIQILKKMNIMAIGSSTQAQLKYYGFNSEVVSKHYSSEGLIDHFKQEKIDLKGRRILLPRSEQATSELPNALQKLGGNVYPCVIYQTQPCFNEKQLTLFKEQLQKGDIGAITFASPSAVKAFKQHCKHLTQEQSEKLNHVILASIGPVTSQALKTLFGRVDVEALEHTSIGLANALKCYFSKFEEGKD